MVKWASFGAALAGAFLLGQKTCQQDRLDSMDDSINRIAQTQYVLLDMSMRTNHFVNPSHKPGTPFCPECFEILSKIDKHSEVITEENAKDVIQGN